jgi:hypothetical protein
MTRSIVKLALPLLVAFAAGCASTGTGFGWMGSRADPVNSNLENSDAVSGSINATVPDDQPASAQLF